MIRFTDAQGRAWDALVGRESWGTFLLLFVPAGHDAPVRQALLGASSAEEAERELDTLGAERLRELLGTSTIKQD